MGTVHLLIVLGIDEGFLNPECPYPVMNKSTVLAS